MLRPRLGEMLLEAQVVRPSDLDRAMSLQRSTGRRFGEILVELGFISEEQLAQTLSSQLSIPWVDLRAVEFSRELLNLVPEELARSFSIVPVYIRKLSRGQTLFVATDDPTNEEALQRVANIVHMPVKPMVAPFSDVRNAIRVYYGPDPYRDVPTANHRTSLLGSTPSPRGVDGAADSTPTNTPAMESARPRSITEPSIPSARLSSPPGIERRRRTTIEPEAREDIEPTAPKSEVRMVTFTLLDGTAVRLPAKDQDAANAVLPKMTSRDWISALIAKAEGKDISEVASAETWELFTAAMLSVLIRKGLLADWEFVEELEKLRRPEHKS